MPQFTDKQIEIANIINSVGDFPAGTIDEILAIVEDTEKKDIKPSTDSTETETQLKMRILNEPDWRKRVVLSAMIISNSFS